VGPSIVVRGRVAGAMLARGLSTVGQTVEKVAVRWSRVLVSVVPAWPMGKAMTSTRLQYLLRAAMRGEYFLVFLSNLTSQPRFLKKPISTMMGALFYVKGGRVGGGSVWDPPCIDKIRCCVMSGFEQHLGLSSWEGPNSVCGLAPRCTFASPTAAERP